MISIKRNETRETSSLYLPLVHFHGSSKQKDALFAFQMSRFTSGHLAKGSFSSRPLYGIEKDS